MQVYGASEFRSNMATAFDYAYDAHSPVLIKSGKKTFVLLSLDDYNSHTETTHLLSSKTNAARLLKGVEAVKNSEIKTKDLIDD